MKGRKIRRIDGATVDDRVALDGAAVDGAGVPGFVFLDGFNVGMACFVTSGVFATVVMDAITRMMS